MLFLVPRILALALLFSTLSVLAQEDSRPQYIRAGNETDVFRKTKAGLALMGGGKDQDEAFLWMCQKAGGGDFVILRATGTDAYNPYIQKLCPELNSVSTLIVDSRPAANDPITRRALHDAEAIFIAGGDQSNYVKFWGKTAVTEEIDSAIRRGVPIGGTSAGLAVLGEFAYSAMNDTVTSPDALANPFHERVTIERNFLQIPQLRGLITDSHFAKRDRMGRLVVFLARILKDARPEVRGLGIDERSVVLLEPDGKAKVVGEGQGAYMLSAAEALVYEISLGHPLVFAVSVEHAKTGDEIDFIKWKSSHAEHYSLSASSGKLHSSKPTNEIY